MTLPPLPDQGLPAEEILAALAALRELENAIDRMAAEGRNRRIDALLAKERDAGLSAEEKAELQQLMASRAGSMRPGAVPGRDGGRPRGSV